MTDEEVAKSVGIEGVLHSRLPGIVLAKEASCSQTLGHSNKSSVSSNAMSVTNESEFFFFETIQELLFFILIRSNAKPKSFIINIT